MFKVNVMLVRRTLFPAGSYMFKVNNRSTRTRSEIFIVNNKDIRTTPMTAGLLIFLILAISRNN